ncbi:sensor histidine kinase N-terminal domain-containing protein [Paracoccus sp. MBLB3053]|uniref:histidine kinase n=1 Tax=Paracoccus aurantius TaxID=3073814 RepID=A0ABU2HZN7_9RHOB|nr:ATP-binding protein [Paracoccus sp. MBLB3053]MDS9470015.1 sensor histidine kinase N-terminal domain-containing protein [Paracoccus sp. MBLB3053]
MSSIRKRLFVILLIATGAVWLSGVTWLQYSARAEVGRVLDRRLEEAAKMVVSLLAGGNIDPEVLSQAAARAPAPVMPMMGSHSYLRQLACQIWGLDGELISDSAGAPRQPLVGETEGFAESAAGGEKWRVYSLVDQRLGIRVMVGDAVAVRERLVNRVTFGLLIPALLALPILAGLIWWAVGRGLQPLDRLANELGARAADDLSPLPHRPVPRELRPMTHALDDLFHRVETMRNRERNFTAYAAHELKTPLAGLKTQAQIAGSAPDEPTRRHALGLIVEGVNRTDRMVRQLLDMTAVESAGQGRVCVPAQQVLAEVVRDLRPVAEGRDVALRVDAPGCPWQTPHGALLASAMRNVIENALNAAPTGSVVDIELGCDQQGATFRVLDQGPGIQEMDRAYVTQRFYRGAGSSGSGSGLGLAIVAEAARRMSGRLRLMPRPGGGEIVEITWPQSA